MKPLNLIHPLRVALNRCAHAGAASLGLFALTASAAPVSGIRNGSFEETTTSGVWVAAASWTEVSGTDAAYSLPTGTESIPATDGTRFLRLQTEGNGYIARVAQNLGIMVAGETYTFRADVIASTAYGDYGATAAFVNEGTAAPVTTYATQTVTVAQGATGRFILSYTATAPNNGKNLYIWLQAEPVKGLNTLTRGGIDNVRLSDKEPASPPAAATSQITQGAPAAGPDPIAKGVQAGFYTPGRTGGIWDNWACYHEGKFYLYYVAGPPGKNDPRIPPGYLKDWNSFGLATSDDGVHWKEYGTIAKCREKTSMGSGHIWKSPNFAHDGTWIMNYSEFFGEGEDYWSHVPNFCGQNIIFLTSTDLLHWTKVDESFRFNADGRWYKEKGRWDSMDVLPRPDGSLYAYFTAEPVPEKLDYKACYAVGFAESKDGLHWQALPPLPGETAGEVGGVEKLGAKYYMTIGAGEIFCADRPDGPFLRQKKNPNMLDKDSDAYYSRFFHTAPGGPLVNSFYWHGIAHAAPFKAIDIDAEEILRLKWWKGNEKLKERKVSSALAAESAESRFVRFLEPALNLDAASVIEASLTLPETDTPMGFYLDSGDGTGQVVLFTRQGTQFGTANLDGSGRSTGSTLTRDLDFAGEVNVRLVLKKDMIETYMNDYLMNTKRVKCNGRIGVIGQTGGNYLENIKVWTQL